MEVKDRKEQKRVSKQTFNKHSLLLTSSFVCGMDVLWDWWCWTQLLSIVSSKWQQKRITYLSLCEGGLWRIWRTYEWSVEKKNRLEGEYWHMGYQLPNRKTIHNMHVCQRERYVTVNHTLTQTYWSSSFGLCGWCRVSMWPRSGVLGVGQGWDTLFVWMGLWIQRDYCIRFGSLTALTVSVFVSV